jgi:hypothetical protein
MQPGAQPDIKYYRGKFTLTHFYYAKVVTFESFWRLLALKAVGARDIATEIWASAELPHWSLFVTFIVRLNEIGFGFRTYC